MERLGEDQVLARQRSPDFVFVHALDGVHRDDADDRGACARRFLDDGLDDLDFYEGTDGVVHGHDIGRGFERAQRIFHRLLA